MLVTVTVYFAAQLFAGLLLYLVLSLFGWDSSRITRWLAGTGETVPRFVMVVVYEAVIFVLLYGYIRHRKALLSDIGLNRLRSKHIAYALLGFVVYLPLNYMAVTLIKMLIPSLDTGQAQQLGFAAASGQLDLLLIFISLVILPPLVEELVCRGFLYSGLRTKLTMVPASLIVSGLFALPHLQFDSGKPLLWIAAIDTFILSMVLVYVREKSGSLWPAIGLHAIKNGIAFVAIFILHLA